MSASRIKQMISALIQTLSITVIYKKVHSAYYMFLFVEGIETFCLSIWGVYIQDVLRRTK